MSGMPTPSRSALLTSHLALGNAVIPRWRSVVKLVRKTCVTAAGLILARSESRATMAGSGNPGSTRITAPSVRMSTVVECPVRTGVRSPHKGWAANVPIEITRTSSMPERTARSGRSRERRGV